MAGGSDNRSVRGDVRGQIRAFLSTRRARISPEQAGLPVYHRGRRRVSGLRREEVAVLAGISTEYYTRFERGNATGVSDSVIDGIAHALQLDDAERTHLVDLIRTAGTTRPPRRRPAPQRVRPAVQRILDSMTGTPAFVLNGRLDILTANALGHALYSPIYADPDRPANTARFIFLAPRATQFFCDWDKIANDTVALLRAEAGRDPYDRAVSDLIGELSTRSEEFRVRWAAHNVRIHTTGVKLIHHPVVGDLELPFESFPIPADPRQSMLTYTAEPDSPTQDALTLLASWAATTDSLEHAASTDDSEQAGSVRERLTDRVTGSRVPLISTRAAMSASASSTSGGQCGPDPVGKQYARVETSGVRGGEDGLTAAAVAPAMTGWTSEELTRIADAEELRIASRRRDGSLRTPVTIWVVRHRGNLYVRSVNGPTAAWYRKKRKWSTSEYAVH